MKKPIRKKTRNLASETATRVLDRFGGDKRVATNWVIRAMIYLIQYKITHDPSGAIQDLDRLKELFPLPVGDRS
ncbi:MAG: hypothetical protein ACRCZI_03060 [Cetobacterium sp.]